MRSFALGLMAALALAGCEQEDPCGDYVDYICACHADDEAFDCEELRTTYANADADVQDECAIALDDQQSLDSDQGLDCEV
jgi:hypothetical protein